MQYKLTSKKPESGDRCLVYLGHGWRELYWFDSKSGSKGEGFYTYSGNHINPYNKVPVWMESPPYPY